MSKDQLTKRETVALALYRDIMEGIRVGSYGIDGQPIKSARSQDVMGWAFEEADEFLRQSRPSEPTDKLD